MDDKLQTAGDDLGADPDQIGDDDLIDVRKAAAFDAADSMIPTARWRDPADVDRWAGDLPVDRAVVVYCVHGHEVSRSVATRLVAAGLRARFLRGGIEGWRAAGRPLAAKPEVRTTTRAAKSATVALLYPGDRAARDRADPAASRFAALFDAFAAAGVAAEPAVWHDDFADEVAAQLRGVQAVLVWCNPIEGGRRRDRLDALLREVADAGVFVSTHPETIARLGTKDVLVETADLPFGSDVCRVDSLAQLAAELPARLCRGARVLKQHRGHSGIGVWRVQAIGGTPEQPLLTLRHAQRGSDDETSDLDGLLRRMAPYFEAEAGGHMVDQAWQPRLADGMVRAYLVEDHVTGFGHQAINALLPPTSPGQAAPQPGPRLYHGPDMPAFRSLKDRLEGGWIDLLREGAGVARDRLPKLWDCDFMFGDPAPDGSPTHVLCEVNVSSVSPFPPSSIAPLVDAVRRRIARSGG